MIARLKFDISNLVNEMLDYIPQDLLINGTVLDPAIGGGQFVREVERRKRAAGKSDEEIKRTVIGIEENILRRDYAVNKHKLVGTYEVGDFLDMDLENVKIDVIVGNPPFQKSDNAAKRWTLWDLFVKKSLDLADVIAMVTPQSITSPGPFSMIKDVVDVINVDVSKHFNVGSTFCYFVINNPQHGLTKIITDENTFHHDVSNIPFLPFVINQHTLDQIDWLKNRESRKWKRGELHTSNKELFDENGQYTVVHTNAQTFKTDFEHPNRSKIRVCVSLSGYPQFQVIKNAYASQACMWTEFDTEAEAVAFAAECNGPFIQELLSVFKWSGWNSKEVIEYL